MTSILIVLISYFIGSIPFGAILVCLSGNGNIKKLGSGNIGATNVLRTGKTFLALLTLLLDAFKGFITVFTIKKLNYSPDYIYLSCISTIAGHIFPIWLLFKGGKGVATFLGTLIAINFYASIMFVFIWIIVFSIFKYSSLSSLVALILSITMLCYNNPDMILEYTLLVLLITSKHLSNIKRLIKKEEYKFQLDLIIKKPFK